MSSSPVASISVAPVATTAAALRAEILGAAEGELIAILGEAPAIDPTAPHVATTAGAAPANPVTQAVDTARTAAAVQQGSLAPLFADLAETLSLSNLPAPIKAAIGQILALQLPTEGAIAPEDVRQAVAQSGLFLEAGLASPGAPAPRLDLKAALLTLQQALPAPPPAPAAEAPQVQAPAPAAAPPPQASAAVASAAGPVAAASIPSTPIQTAQIPAAQIDTAQPSPAPTSAEPAQVSTTPTPPSLTEAPTGQPPQPQATAGGPAPPPVLPPTATPTGLPPQPAYASVLPATPAPLDPKAALLALQTLPEPQAEDTSAEPALRDLRAALLALRQAAPGAGPPDTPASARRTAPPTRDAALSPQAPAPATLPEHADLAALAEHLRPEVDQALARLTLHQLASLPDGASSAWMFELPVATPQGTAMAQFEIERDGAGSGGADSAQPWRARFSIDIEPLGPVHVHVAMSGGKAAVSVWAERADSLDWLRGQGAELATALPAEVVFRQGAPRGEAPASGHFLDQTS